MRFLYLVLISTFSGIFAGMGMGGGTFLIPILYLFFGIGQVILQSTNVISFLFLSVICFVIYLFQKLIDFKTFFCVAIPAGLISFLGTFFTLKIESNLLHILFSCFIILVGIFCLIMTIKNFKKS